MCGNLLKSRSSLKISKRSMKELERIATRIEGRMAELEKIVASLSKGLKAK